MTLKIRGTCFNLELPTQDSVQLFNFSGNDLILEINKKAKDSE